MNEIQFRFPGCMLMVNSDLQALAMPFPTARPSKEWQNTGSHIYLYTNKQT